MEDVIINNIVRKNVSNDIKVEGDQIKKAASDLDMKYNTARSIIRIYEREGRIISKQRGWQPTTNVTEEIKDAIEEMLEENRALTLLKIMDRHLEEFDVNCCIETIRKILGSLRITFKRASNVLEKVNKEEMKIKRKIYSLMCM